MTAALRGVGILAALVLAVVHGYLVPEHLEEKFYVGVLFVLGTVLLVVAIVGLVIPRLHRLGWWLGAVVAAGMFVGYVLSRTVGLPGGYMEGWDEPLGTLSLIVEVVFVVAAAVAVVAGTPRGGRRGAVAAG